MIRFHPNVDAPAATWHLLSAIRFAVSIGKLDNLLGCFRRLGNPQGDYFDFASFYADLSAEDREARDKTFSMERNRHDYLVTEPSEVVLLSPDGMQEPCFGFVLYVPIHSFEKWLRERYEKQCELEDKNPLEKGVPLHYRSKTFFEQWAEERAIRERASKLSWVDSNFFDSPTARGRGGYWNGGEYNGVPLAYTYNGGIIYHARAKEWSTHT